MFFPFFYFFYLNPILIAAAVIPAVVLLVKVYKVDHLDKESPRLLWNLVVRGVLPFITDNSPFYVDNAVRI